MSAARYAIVGALLAGCTTNSAVDTGETWSQPSAQQIADFQVSPPGSVNPYLQERPPPKMKNGCSLSVVKENGALVIPALHPDEVYCFRLAALSNTTIELPPGARLQTASSAMLRFIQIESANTVERDIMLLTSHCVPPRKDDAGVLQPAELMEFVDLPFCPRPTAEITVVLSTGVVQFKAFLNNSTHDARVVMQDAAPAPRPVGIPVRSQSAQDLYATAIGDEVIPWTPDDAWSDAASTVIVWHRPMPTLPAMMLGPNGEQRASPLVVNDRGATALVYTDRVTRFQLRLDDRTLAFSDKKPERKHPAEE